MHDDLLNFTLYTLIFKLLLMKALITGGAGFIGSHLAEYLLKNGYEVAVLDNLSTGSVENLETFKDNPQFSFNKGDILNTELTEQLIEKCDCVFHLAAAVGVKLIAEKPVRTIETNIEGATVVLNAAYKFKKKIFIASTSEIYGKNENVPFDEDDNIVLGSTSVSRWSYACTKAVDEFLGLAFYQQYGFPVVIGRFFNTIGARQTGRYGMVVPRFVQAALKNEPIEIYGTGAQSRCFCYVGDVVEAIAGLMNCPQAAGKVYNIGSTEEISIEQLADKIIEIAKSKSKKKFISYEQAYGREMEDMLRRKPSLKRINQAIGWQPKTTLDETLKMIIEKQKAEFRV